MTQTKLFNEIQHSENWRKFVEMGCKLKGYPVPKWDNLITYEQLERIEELYKGKDQELIDFEQYIKSTYRVFGLEYISRNTAEKLISIIEKKQNTK